MKKVLAFCLALVLVLSMAACNTKPTEDDTTTPAPTTQAPTQKPDDQPTDKPDQPTEPPVEEPRLPLVKDGSVTLTIGIPQNAFVEDYDTNYLTRFLEEKTGVNLEFVFYSTDYEEANQQFSLDVSSGAKLPDILFNFNKLTGDSETALEYGRSGVFVDVSGYLKEYGYYYWEGYNMIKQSVRDMVDTYWIDPQNGKQYGLGNGHEQVGDAVGTYTIINKAWLDKIGEAIPTTAEELHRVLKKFAEEDPNGNGTADELAMFGSVNGYHTDILEYIINAWVYCNDEQPFNVDEGKVWLPYTTDEYRQAIIFLNQLFKEGLIPTQIFTMTSEEAKTVMKSVMTPETGTSIVGLAAAVPSVYMISGSENAAEYVALAPLKAETKLGGYGVNVGDAATATCYITRDCEDPVLAFKFLDYMYSTEVKQVLMNGEKGVDWVEEQGTTAQGIPAIIKRINNVYGQQNNSCWNTSCIGWLYSGGGADGTIGDTNRVSDQSTATDYQKATNGFAKDLYKMYTDAAKPGRIFKLIYTADEADAIKEPKTNITSYIKESRAQFISGEMDPNDDAKWAAYLKTLEDMGVKTWLDAAQKAYDRTQK